MSERKCVLVPQPVHPDALELLQSHADVVLGSGKTEVELYPGVDSCHAILVRTASLPGSVIRRASKLRVIARHGVGVDNVDLEAATACGIPVVNTPEANAASVAEHVIGMMVAAVKAMHRADTSVRDGDFAFRDSHLGLELSGKTIGILGLGRVGSRLAHIAKDGFDMTVLGYDPYLPAARFEELGVEQVHSVAEILPRSDFLSLHLPLTEETRSLIGSDQLTAMKPTAVLVNAARGGLVDETALVEALRQQVIRGAALDVFAEEPPPRDHPLWHLPNVLLTPHMAAHTEEAMRRMAMGAAERIVEVLDGRPPRSVVNPEFE